jgi:hypothetical protein
MVFRIADRRFKSLFNKDKISFKELKSLLRKYNLRQTLALIAQYSAIVFNHSDAKGQVALYDPPTKVFIGQFALAYIANTLLLSGATDSSNKLMQHDELKVLCATYIEKLKDQSIPELIEDFDGHDALTLIIIKNANEQQSFRIDCIADLVARELIYWKTLVPKLISNKSININFNMIFQQETGLTLEEYIVIGLSIFTVIANKQDGKGIFNIENLTAIDKELKEKIGKVVNVNNLKAFLKIMSTNYSGFKKEDSKLNLLPKFKFNPDKHRFNSLWSYPVIETDRTKGFTHIVPSIPIYIKTVFGGLYWWFHRYYEKLRDQSKNPDKDLVDDFRKQFGCIFQEYVGMILGQTFGASSVIREFRYGPKNASFDFLDWTVIQGDKAYVFEVSAIQFDLDIRLLPTKTKLDLFVEKMIIKKIKQLKKQMNNITATNTDGSYKYQHDTLSILRSKKIIPILVVLDVPFCGAELYKRRINTIVKSNPEEHDSLIDFDDYNILGIDELEKFDSVATKCDLEKLFLSYKGDPENGFISSISKIEGYNAENKFLREKYFEYEEELMPWLTKYAKENTESL